jgi:hypothetical protein
MLRCLADALGRIGIELDGLAGRAGLRATDYVDDRSGQGE